MRGGLAVATVSNLWLERVFLMSEFDTLACSQKGQHMNASSWKTAMGNVQHLRYLDLLCCCVCPSESKSFYYVLILH